MSFAFCARCHEPAKSVGPLRAGWCVQCWRTPVVADSPVATPTERPEEPVAGLDYPACEKCGARLEEGVAPALCSTCSEPATKPLKRKARKKRPPLVEPIKCAILAIDPGETSGWAIWLDGKLYDHGVCEAFTLNSNSMRVVVECFDRLTRASPKVGEYPRPAPIRVVVVEKPFRARGSSGANIGAADTLWRRVAVQYGLRRVFRVHPSTWRAATLGGKWVSAKRDDVRAQEQAYVEHQWGKKVHPDEAPAILIGLWAAHSEDLLDKLPKGVRKARAA